MKNFSSKTKENYLHNSKATSIRKYLVWVVGAFVVLFGAKGMLGALSASFTMPIFSVHNYIQESSGTVPVFIRDRLSLLTQIRALEENVIMQKGMEATVAYLTSENTELRALQGASSSPRIIAGVIARPPYTPYDTIIIDQGSEDGIVLHAPVYQGGGNAIGYIREVFDKTALAVLFSSPGVESTVFVFGPNLFTTAYGEGGGIIRLSIPQGVWVEKGNVVILPSLDTGVIGSIQELVSNPTEPEQRAYISPEISLQSTRLVSVGKTSVRIPTFDEAMEVVRKEEQKLFTFEVPPHASMQMSTSSEGALDRGSGSSTTATSTRE
jgi:cell shape-determining protein MreC